MKQMLKIRLTALLALCALYVLAANPKYVFLFIGDGMSTPQRMLTEEYLHAMGQESLTINSFKNFCYTRTCSANSIVTDSAASATAIACGEKTNSGMLGVTPGGKHLESIAVVAKKKGMKVGIMTTVPIVHATPAGFYAHRKSRNDSYGIAVDLLDSDFDFFAGSGVYDKFDYKKHKDYRGNVYELAKKAGYVIAHDKQSFAEIKPGNKVWGVFGSSAMPYAIDGYGKYPELSEMVAKAIEMLEGPNGFFIMAEGGKIDYASHDNDAATMVHEVIAMDRAVKVAVEFMNKHPEETLIVTTGDHETGGLALGNPHAAYQLRAGLLKHQKCSAEVFSGKITKLIKNNPAITFKDVQPIVEENFGLVFEAAKPDAKPDAKKFMRLSEKEIAKLNADFTNDVAFVNARKEETRRHDVKRRKKFAASCKYVLNTHACVSWSVTDHTALPTVTTAVGCGAEKFVGLLDNTDISRLIKDMIK